jgi:hypothetical protein
LHPESWSCTDFWRSHWGRLSSSRTFPRWIVHAIHIALDISRTLRLLFASADFFVTLLICSCSFFSSDTILKVVHSMFVEPRDDERFSRDAPRSLTATRQLALTFLRLRLGSIAYLIFWAGKTVTECCEEGSCQTLGLFSGLFKIRGAVVLWIKKLNF